MVLQYSTAASRGQEWSILGEHLVSSFFQAKDNMFPRPGHGNPSSWLMLRCSLLSTYCLIYQHMHLDLLASIHLNQTAILQMQEVRSSQTLQQTLATECKNKGKKKKKKTPFEKQPWWKHETLNTSHNTNSAVLHNPTCSHMFPNPTTVSFCGPSEGDRHWVLYDE